MQKHLAPIAGLIFVLALVATATAADAASRRGRDKAPAHPAAAPADKRDRVVKETASPFNNRPYWMALGQCGGIIFKLARFYTDGAIRARVIKPDRKADALLTEQAETARRTATAFFVGAERFLVADRGLSREDAIRTYDASSIEAGARLKSADAAMAAARPCPPLYNSCRAKFEKACDGQLAAIK
ncbi:MAG: hypothetical protein HY056_15380 [Proteobacteria bacterium]|nr:hypothetical protein [Pseudomonadota bacterium]